MESETQHPNKCAGVGGAGAYSSFPQGPGTRFSFADVRSKKFEFEKIYCLTGSKTVDETTINVAPIVHRQNVITSAKFIFILPLIIKDI